MKISNVRRLILVAIVAAGLAVGLTAGSAGAQESGAPESGAGVDRNNVVIVLDSSGSMDSMLRSQRFRMKKIDAAKKALKDVLGDISADTNVGLLVFSAGNIPDDNVWVYPLGPKDDARLKRAIDLPTPSGSTPLGEFIKQGADRLLSQREKQRGYGTYRLLIVTDGEADDPALVDQYVADVLSRGITMDVIGVDMAGDHTLATRVHSYRRADDPESLKKALTEVFAEVSDVGSDVAGEDSFELLAAIPDEMASAMIKALSESGNYPIGEQPAATAEPVSDDAPPGPAPDTTPDTSAPPPASKKPCGLAVIVGLAALAPAAWRTRARRKG